MKKGKGGVVTVKQLFPAPVYQFKYECKERKRKEQHIRKLVKEIIEKDPIPLILHSLVFCIEGDAFLSQLSDKPVISFGWWQCSLE